MKVCSRCVMDSTDREIRFNAEGVCDHCITFDREIMPDWQLGNVKDEQLG